LFFDAAKVRHKRDNQHDQPQLQLRSSSGLNVTIVSRLLGRLKWGKKHYFKRLRYPPGNEVKQPREVVIKEFLKKGKKKIAIKR
jgi:hypothetical protein